MNDTMISIDDDRQFTFAGEIVALHDKYNRTASIITRCYVVRGRLFYVGRCANGASCYLPIWQEPTTNDVVYPNSKSKARHKKQSNDDDNDNMQEDVSELSSGSQAEEVNTPAKKADAQEKAAAALAEQRKKAAEKKLVHSEREMCIIVVRDNNRLPFPHVGMSVKLYLKRGEYMTPHWQPFYQPNSDDTNDTSTPFTQFLRLKFRDFVYDITSVTGYKANVGLPTKTLYENACADIKHALREDLERELAARSLAERNLKVGSFTALQEQRYHKRERLFRVDDEIAAQLQFIFPHQINNRRALSFTVTGSNNGVSENVLASLSSMSRICKQNRFANLNCMIVNSFQMAAALSHSTLCAHNIAVAHHHRRNIMHVVASLKLHKIEGGYQTTRLLNTTSTAEIFALADICKQLHKSVQRMHVLALFVAEFATPLWYNIGPRNRLLHLYEGPAWKLVKSGEVEERQSALRKHAIAHVTRVLGTTEFDHRRIISAARLLSSLAARYMRWMMHNTMFDITEIIKLALQRRNRVLLDLSEGNPESPLLKEAMRFLCNSGSWHTVPRATVERHATHARAMNMFFRDECGKKTVSLYCTRFAWQTSFRLAGYLHKAEQLKIINNPGSCWIPSGAPALCSLFDCYNGDSALYVYCGQPPKIFKHSNKNGVKPKESENFLRTIAFHALFYNQQCTDNDAMPLIELLPFTKIILFDAHLLSEPELLQFMTFLGMLDELLNKELFIVGDRAATWSTFATLWKSPMLLSESMKPFWPAPKPSSSKPATAATSSTSSTSQQTNHAIQAVRCAIASIAYSPTNLPMAITKFRAMSNVVKLGDNDIYLTKSGIERRWIIVANSIEEAEQACDSALQDLQTLPVDPSLRDNSTINIVHLSALLAAYKERRGFFKTHVAFTSPYIGFISHHVCVHVRQFYHIEYMPHRTQRIARDECVVYTLPKDAVEKNFIPLDNNLLLLELDESDMSVGSMDHMQCCNTWAPNIVRVARHRSDIVSQSFSMARDALACAHTEAPVLLFAKEYRYPDMYGAIVTSSPMVAEQYIVVKEQSESLWRCLGANYAQPKTFIGDMLE